MSSKKINLRKSLAFATVSTSLAMVACDFSADTTVKASDDPTPGPVSELPEGAFLQVNTLEDLPNCTPSREGKSAYVNISNSVYVCSNERWTKASVTIDPIVPPEESSSSIGEIVPETSSSGLVPPPPPPPYYDCFQTWYGTESVYRIETGFDNGSETSGYWFAYGDDADGGASRIIWPVPPGNEYDENAFDPIIDHCGGICGTYYLDHGGNLVYDPFVGVGFSLAGYDNNGIITVVDASSMGGIRITYTSDAPAVLELGMGDYMDQKVGYDVPFVTLPKATAPTTKVFTWADFKQAGWGSGKITGEEAATMLAVIKFKIQSKSGSTGSFNIMAIGAFDETCSSYIPPMPRSSSSFVPPEPKSSSSFYVPYYGFETWYGYEGVYKIETGLDAGEDMSGYWYEFNDAVDGGESKIIWPVPKGTEWDDNALDPIIDYCAGVCGTYQLEQGKMDYNPFVGIAFDIAGPADYWDGPAVAADASAMGGLCIAYTSDFAASLELGLSDEKEAEVGYDIPFASLPKATSVVVKDIPWSSFKQAGWGTGKITGEEAAAMLKSVRFKIQGKDGMTGSFNVMSVGALGGGCSAERYFTVIPTVDVVKLNEKKIDR
ncbi:hypothetical protein [Fibrobacter sp. UWB5]|uniref:hypothetical protein n=1 Tax=Fibrobacter sp. UWB5 TaxID=1964360 RepID=UPI000B52817B|nr:hypothetical protein [Fibrobacter sp. UWB5]OWV14456.1 hypothetical protein B7989_03105 [Fibrobacter sp. UWB5]